MNAERSPAFMPVDRNLKPFAFGRRKLPGQPRLPRVFSGPEMRRFAPFVLLVLLAALTEPFARGAVGSNSCCCPDGMSSCSASGDSCSMRNGCGADRAASPIPLTVFFLPAEAVPEVRVSEARIEAAPAASPDSRRVVVPDPPPRA